MGYRIVVVLILLVLTGCSGSDQPERSWREKNRDNARFLEFTRPDGARCWMVFAGSHNGIAGVTCKE